MLSHGKRRSILFVDQRTQPSFLILEVQRFEPRKSPDFFWGGLTRFHQLHTVQAGVAEEVVAPYKELVLAPTPSASLTAHMNNLAQDYKQLAEVAEGIEPCNISTIIHSLKQRPRKSLNWPTPEKVVRDLINATTAH
jgi:hypothetical protein